jgi:Flp pilus assembly pilin Flp
MTQLRKLWVEQGGQDIAEYAVMLAVILVIVVGTIRMVGSSADNVFSNAASSFNRTERGVSSIWPVRSPLLCHRNGLVSAANAVGYALSER